MAVNYFINGFISVTALEELSLYELRKTLNLATSQMLHNPYHSIERIHALAAIQNIQMAINRITARPEQVLHLVT